MSSILIIIAKMQRMLHIFVLILVLCSRGIALPTGLKYFNNKQSFNKQSINSKSCIYSSSTDQFLWNEKVQYVDLTASSLEFSSTARSLPLFLLSGAFYPQGETFLNIFEMKYRTMMFDCANSDDMFGYIHTDSKTGSIASIGTLCKITDRQLLEDGRQYIYVEGVSRFKVRKILKTLPYVTAEIEPNINDELPVDLLAEAALIKLEKEVYDSLKYYMRLMKTFSNNKDIFISRSCKRNRPIGTSTVISPSGPSKTDHERRINFSFSLANMIKMTHPTESQLLLQTLNLSKRLEAEKVILQQASELVADQLIKMDILTADTRDGLKLKSFNDDFDEDILPEDFTEDKMSDAKDEWDINNIE